MKFDRLIVGSLFAMGALLIAPVEVSATSAPPQAGATQGQITATGTVYDDTGEPCIGVTVKQKGTTNGTTTDIDGNFSLKVKPGAELEFTYVGCQPVTMKAGSGMEIHMKSLDNMLEQVVVVGFGTQKKVNLTGSVGVATAKDIEGRPVQNTAAALQGVIPGLNITNSSDGGNLNASKQMNVRGMAVIDTDFSSGAPLVLIDGMEGDMNSINPQDIESISVLKDAASSSIYGSRAPFGVILIKTKNGSAGKVKISYNDSFRFNQPLTPMHTMDSWEYISYLNDVARYSTPGNQEFPDDYVEGAWLYYTGQSDNFIYQNKWVGDYRRWGTGECGGTFANVNWLDELYKKTAFAQEHNLTVTGGNEKVTYYLSGNLLDQNGFLKYGNDTYKRYTLNGKFSAKPFSWLTVNYTSRWMRTDYERPHWLEGGFYEKVLRRLPPTNPKYDPNGYIAADYNYILHLQDGGRYKTQDDIFTNQVQIIATPLPGWNINAEFNARVNNYWLHDDYKLVYAHDADDLDGLSSETTHLAFDCGEHSWVKEQAERNTYLNYNIYSDYNFSIADKNNFKVMLGFQAEDFKKRQLGANRNDMLLEDLPVLNLTTSSDSYGLWGEYQKWRTAGFFGRINYDFMSKYLIEVNLRYDGSSRFRRGHRWVWSPSVSAGWNIDHEKFWEPILPYVNALKIRASYGQLANQNTNGWYPTYRTMGIANQGTWWTVNGQKPATAWFPDLISTSLTWEKILNTNIGIDAGAFNNRLTASFDYFWRTNKDMMGPAVTYPAILGASVPRENTLSLRTYGWELQIGWRDVIGDFSYSAKLNLSDNQTKILKYPNPENYLFSGAQWNPQYIAGQVVGQIYGFETVGIARTQEEMDAHLAKVDQSAIGSNWQAGDMMYADLNGDGKITRPTTLEDLKDSDVKVIGNSTPRYNFGLSLNAAWKGIDVTLFFQGVMKRDYYFNPYGVKGTGGKSAVFWGATTGGRWESIFFREHLDYWRDDSSPLGANYDAYYARPLYYTNKNREQQTRYLQNGAYMRLKNLQIGYTFPRQWTEKFACTMLRVYFSAENLFTVTKMSKVIDPESLDVSSMKSGSAYPLAKTYSFGLQIDF